MRTRTGYSTDKTASVAVEQALSGIINPKCLLFFSPYGMFDEVSEILSKRFPGCTVCGVSAASSFSPEIAWASNPYACGLSITEFGDDFECVAGLIDYNDTRNTVDRIKHDLEAFESKDNMICLEFVTAHPMDEEIVLDVLYESLYGTGIPVVGSSCGNEMMRIETKICLNGRVLRRSGMYLLLRNRLGPVKIYQANIYRTTRRELTATDVDLSDRLVYEFDDIPAAEALSRELSISIAKLKEEIGKHPLGRYNCNDLKVIDIAEINPDNSIRVCSCVYGGTKVQLLELDDYRVPIQKFIEKIRKESPTCFFGVTILGVSLTRFWKNEEYLEEYFRDLSSLGCDYIGIAGMGEQMGRFNFNKTALFVAFEDDGKGHM